MTSSQEKSASETQEFTECAKMTITMVNSGTFKDKNRGSQRAKIAETMAARREQIVSLIQKQTVRASEKLRGIRLVDWLEENPGKCPKEEGHEVKPILLVGESAPVDCVCLRLLPKGYFDVDLEASTSAEVKEAFLNSKDAMRQGQVTDTIAALNNATTGDLARAAQKAKVLEPDRRALPAPAPVPPTQLQRDREGPEAQDAAEQSEEQSSDSDDSSAGDPLCSLILGTQRARERSRTPTKTGKRAGGAGSSAAAASSNLTKQTVPKTKAPGKSPKKVSAAPTAKPLTCTPKKDKERERDSCCGSEVGGTPRGKARGKGARLPTDVEELLSREGFKELYDQFQKVQRWYCYILLIKTRPGGFDGCLGGGALLSVIWFQKEI